jgi:hypothetical protein
MGPSKGKKEDVLIQFHEIYSKDQHRKMLIDTEKTDSPAWLRLGISEIDIFHWR